MGRIFSFGEIGGVSVPLVTLQGPGGILLETIGYGAAIRGLWVPDRDGSPVDICLGYDTLEQYQKNDGCLGATVGRCANRIAGASFSLGGERFHLTPNEGKHTLHSGGAGFHQRIWELYELTDCSVVYRLRSPHLDGGFPGELETRVTYTLDEKQLIVRYEAVSDRDTVVNLTNHSYWNLAGAESGSALGHRIMINASRYTPAGSDNIPDGSLRPVAGTALDFSRPATIGARIEDPMLAAPRGYDHNYELLGDGMRHAATLSCEETGISLSLFTTLPGLQLYTANYLTGRPGKNGAVYRPRDGVCLETQYYPDAIHHPAFPSTVLRAGERYFHRSDYRFD